ncbi:MAG: DUF6580 family putative transport protein [Candidatus Komeilibacteria bacterium]
MNKFPQILAGLGLISLIIACRLGPHPANFAPVSAAMIITGLYFTGRFRYLIPLTGLIISDLLLGFYAWQIMLIVYSSYGLIYLISYRVKPQINSWLTLALSSSIIFFIVTNFSVWLFSSLYPPNWSGFWHCYLMAIPFFRWTLAGDLFYVLILAASFEFARYYQPSSTKNQLLDKLPSQD